MAAPLSPRWQHLLAWSLFGGLLAAAVAYDRLGTVPDAAPGPAAAIPPVTDGGVAQRKTRFFAFLRPKVEAENARIASQRQRLLEARERLKRGETLPAAERRWLAELAGRYRVQPPEEGWTAARLRPLLRKVDTVPVPLVLAQAAIESDWGRSRFARQGNNLFGLWCFEQGCGLVPLRREPGKSHEVASFASVQAGVRQYLLNLNRHPRYTELRGLRAAARRAGAAPSALELAAGAPEGSEAADRLWDLLVEAGSLETVLAQGETDLDVVERLARRMGGDAAPALLDAMAEAEDRSLRGRLFALVSDLGAGVAGHAVRRLDDDRWFVVRNMLSLLGEISSPEEAGFDPRRFVDHSHPAVREEAYRLLFRGGAEPGLVAEGLRDSAPRVVRAALAAAGPDPREPVLEHVLDLLDDPVDEKTERAAVRAVSRSDDPRVRDRLIDRCREHRFLWRLFRGPLAPPGPVALESLAVLAAGPFDDGTVEKLVEAARASDDESYRRAAEGRRP